MLDGSLQLDGAVVPDHAETTRARRTPTAPTPPTGTIRVRRRARRRRRPHHRRVAGVRRLHLPGRADHRRHRRRAPAARCRPTRRATLRRCGPPTRSRRDWEIGGGAVYHGSSATPTTPTSCRSPATRRWDATLACTQPTYDIRLNVFNLTDKLVLRCADPVGRRPRGAGHRPHGHAVVHLSL